MKLFNTLHTHKKGRSGCIGVIGGADGPTVIRKTKRSNKSKQEFEDFLEYAATIIQPNFHNFCDIEDYLKSNYHAAEYPLSESKKQALKVNVILNHFKHLLDLPKPLGENPTNKQLLEYAKQDTSVEQAKNYPAEALGLQMKAYKIPSDNEDEIIVQLELKTEYLSISNGTEELIQDLLFWSGVTREDIENRTPRFIVYAHALRKSGKI